MVFIFLKKSNNQHENHKIFKAFEKTILRIFFRKPFKCSYVAIATFTICKTLHMLPFLLVLLQVFNTKNECLKEKISSYYYILTLKSHIHTNGEL